VTADDPTTHPIAWTRTGDGEFAYRARFDGVTLHLRVNDFPEEPLYTLFVDYRAVTDLEDWPALWLRPAPTPDQLRVAGEAQMRRGRVDAIVIADWAYRLCAAPPSVLLDALAVGPGSAVRSQVEPISEHDVVVGLRLTPAIGAPTEAELATLLDAAGPPHQPATADSASANRGTVTFRVTTVPGGPAEPDLDARGWCEVTVEGNGVVLRRGRDGQASRGR
jgi:hypothetical protein